MTAMEGISWKRAYAGSLLIHLAVAGLLAVGLAGSVAQHEQEKMYVVDLDASDLTDSGSGHTVEVAFDESVFTNGVLWQQDAETFVCMEPWNGWANSVNEAGRHIELAPGASKTFAWSITIG